ncbi:MAG: hypothetical protein R6U64_02340, partial [Bacteroidales bacterium]
IFLSVLSLQGFSTGKKQEERPWSVPLSLPSGLHSLQNDHAPDLLAGLENKGFFLWRWLFGGSRDGGSKRVSPSQGVIRAPLAKPSRRGSDSQSPTEWGDSRGSVSSNSKSVLGLGSGRKASSNSRSPLNLKGSQGNVSSSSKNPGTLAGRSSGSVKSNSTSPMGLSKRSAGAASRSKNPTALSKNTRRSRSGSTSFRNEPRAPVGPSYRDKYFGQSKREVGLNVGTAHAFTDLTGTKNVPLPEALNYQVQNPDITLGVFARFRIVEWFGLSVALDYAKFSGMDQTGEYDDYINHTFKNQVFELGGKIEFFAPMNFGSPFDVYGFSGLSMLYNDPKVYDAGGLETNPLQSPNIFQPAIPLGIGFNVRLSPRVKLGYELGYRHLIYNYLEGVFIPGTGYDSYFFNQVKVSYGLRLSKH